MAETSPATVHLAQAFEDLQQAGGTWHDYLELRNIARHELGRRSPLLGLLTALTQDALETYQSKLAESRHIARKPPQLEQVSKPARKSA